VLDTDSKRRVNSARRAELSHCDGQSDQAPEPLAVSRKPMADMLGQVYEQFLGKVIRLTAGHQAKVEEKPEVRKAGGVYYTPTYIVDYIVKNAVAKPRCAPVRPVPVQVGA
jgi:type I restriction-modification system DNA methylase subunit